MSLAYSDEILDAVPYGDVFDFSEYEYVQEGALAYEKPVLENYAELFSEGVFEPIPGHPDGLTYATVGAETITGTNLWKASPKPKTTYFDKERLMTITRAWSKADPKGFANAGFHLVPRLPERMWEGDRREELIKMTRTWAAEDG